MSADSSTILCFGEALIDFLAGEPAPGEARTFRQFAGGAPANAAVAVAKLGGRCEFVGMLGEDMFGDFLLHSLSEAGAGVRYVRRTAAAKTALAFVSLDAHGERSFSFYRPPAADLLFRDADFDAGCFTAASVFHACSNSLTDTGIAAATLSGMARARAAGALVSLDLNLRPALWPDATPALPVLWQALEAADLIKLAREELEYLKEQGRFGDRDVVARLLRSARLVLVTDGAAPLRWFTRSRSGELPAFKVKAVDTTAAGDAFIGGLLSQLQRERVDARSFDAFLGQPAELERCLRYASACGALAVTRHGAFAALPTHLEASALLGAVAVEA
ncbi:carbohydrate kinase family protein [Pseudoxanthomonas wuyuanensis]|uniref:Fructokinase n=1 Tax=Pseudoxanthomonas wuyuanensis TaxID=1073196 RepID=A0A286CYP0_9GAMM|nr:carbohydrate kinase [Pseudoxanthomonas wuyuanensis]KAF1722765.1 carbohydrate kinase [Pseudoxanthomonas wuyuanensis]SOD51517.1 fructokinase [Pseudoxanthomonas wuyuanensis]